MKQDWSLAWKQKLDVLTIRIGGSHQQWYRRLLPLYGSWRKRQLEVRIKKEQHKTLCRIGICAVSMLLCGGWLLISACSSIEMKTNDLEEILKQGGKVTLTYGDVQRDMTLEPSDDPQMNASKENELLKAAREQISREMLGNNPDWDHVSGRLHFPKELSGVYVRYETSDPQRISDQGLVDGIGAEGGVPVTIGVTLLAGTAMEQYTLQCTVIPPCTSEDAEQALMLRETTLKSQWNGESEGLEGALTGIGILVPEDLDVQRSLFGISCLILLLLLVGRFSEVEKQREQKRKAFVEEVPMLMDQLILMMNAGLILSEALEMTALTAEGRDEGTDSLFSDLHFLCKRAEESKRPVTVLLHEYATETGCTELVRFSTMLLDHVDRGSASLIQQLKMERSYAMETQWKQREGKCREMEVRLSGPLLLLLSVILLITIGPVMIGV